MHRLYYYLSFTLLYVVFSLFIIWLSPSRNSKWKCFKLILVGAVLIFISSIRMNTGSDYWSYSLIYNRSLDLVGLAYLYLERTGSYGIYILSFLLKSYTNSIGWDTPLENNLIFVITAVFSITLTLYLIKKYSLDIKWSVAIYMLMGYYMIANNILKQEIAMVLLMFAYHHVYHKRFIPYVICTSFAVLFHVTAIIPAILFLFARRIKISIEGLFMIMLIMILFSFAFILFEDFFANMTFLGYTKYFNKMSVYSEASIGRMYSFGLLVAFTCLYYFLNKQRSLVKQVSDLDNSYINLIAIGLIFNSLGTNFWLLSRFSLYFYQFVIFLIPNAIVICNPTPKHLRGIRIALVAFCVFYILFSMDNHYFAYHTIFEEDMEPEYLDDYIYKYEILR